MYKKRSVMKLISLCVSAAFLLGFVISCGGGGGGLSAFNYSDTDQAASASEDATGSIVLAQSMSEMASSMATDGAAQVGYSAPATGTAANTDAIAKIDPRLKTVVDKLTSRLQSTAGSKTTMKARLGKASQKSVTLTADCDNVGTGTITVTGTDNSDLVSSVTYTEATLTLTFTDCRDNMLYTQTSGSLKLYWKKMADGSSTIANATANNLTYSQYDTSWATIIETGTINGTFNSTDNVTSGSGYANVSFNYTDASGTATLFMSGLSNDWTSTTDIYDNTTKTANMNGSFGLSYSDGTNSVSLTISLGNLQDKWIYYFGGSADHWINGSIGITWNPAYCASGIITFTTANDTPLHYNASTDTCPSSGTLLVNNAKIVYGATILVTVNGMTIPYGSCDEMYNKGSGVCL